MRLQQLCTENGVDRRDAVMAALAVEEIAVYAANKKSQDSYMDILVRLDRGNVEIDFRSLGVAFDPHRDEDDDVVYRGFNLYATPNNTGVPREATMTIASIVYGEVNIRVVQEPFSAPRSISLNAPLTVTAYTPFDMEVVLDTDDLNHYRYTYIDNEYDSNIKWLDEDSVLIFAPGTYSFSAIFEYSSIDYYRESQPVTVTVTEPDAPTDWYFLIRRDNKPYLIHRVGISDTAIELCNNELAQANEMAFSANGSTVYVVGAVQFVCVRSYSFRVSSSISSRSFSSLPIFDRE